MFREPDRRRIYLLRHAEAAYLRDDGTPVTDTRIVGLTAQRPRSGAPAERGAGRGRVRSRGLLRPAAHARHRRIHPWTRRTPALEVVPDLEEIRGGDRFDDVTDMQSWIRHVANPWADAAQADSRFLGGERFADFEQRVVPAFTALVRDRSWRTLLIVAHGGVNRVLLNHVMNLPWQGTVSIEQDACCINIVDVDMDGERVERYLVRGVNITGYNLSKRGIGAHRHGTRGATDRARHSADPSAAFVLLRYHPLHVLGELPVAMPLHRDRVGVARLFAQQLAVVVQPAFVERAGRDCRLHRAARFVLVAAIGESALQREIADVGEHFGHALFRIDHLQFAHAGRIEQQCAVRQQVQ